MVTPEDEEERQRQADRYDQWRKDDLMDALTFAKEFKVRPDPRLHDMRTMSLPSAELTTEEFIARFFPPNTQLNEMETEAVEMFLEGRKSAMMWGGGRQIGRTFIRDALRRFLEWEEEWEQRGRTPENVIALNPFVFVLDDTLMPEHIRREDRILLEIWDRWRHQYAREDVRRYRGEPRPRDTTIQNVIPRNWDRDWRPGR
jgi:hypothetical protein